MTDNRKKEPGRHSVEAAFKAVDSFSSVVKGIGKIDGFRDAIPIGINRLTATRIKEAAESKEPTTLTFTLEEARGLLAVVDKSIAAGLAHSDPALLGLREALAEAIGKAE